jgi:hypothetical protein
MSSQDYPAIGFDPAPGQVACVDDLTGKLNKAVTGLESAHATLTEISKGGKTWEGAAASAFAEKVGDLPKYIGDSRDALRAAATQLTDWRTKLASYQDKARQYEAEAKAAKDREQSGQSAHDQAVSAYNQAAADPALRLAGQYYTNPADLKSAQAKIDAASSRQQKAGDDLDAATKELDKARDELEAIIKRAEELLSHHQGDARSIADKLTKANDRAPDSGLWEGLADAFTKVGHSIENWCTKHADLLKKIGDWLSIASAVFGILALATMWFPPLSGAFALAGGVTSLGALATHGAAKIGGADISASTLVFDGVGALPFGKFANGAMRGVKVGLKFGKQGDLMLKGANTFTKVADAAGSTRTTLSVGKLSRLGLSDDIAHFNPEGLGNKASLAWTKHVAETGETNLKGNLYGMALTKPWTRCPGGPGGR